jgi:hypothetical protein
LFAAIASVGAIGWAMVMMAAALLLGAFGLYWFVRLVLAIESMASQRRAADPTLTDAHL